MGVLKDVLNTNNPIHVDTSGQLSGLALNGVYLSTTVFSNMSGDSQGGGFPYAYGVFYAGIPVSGAWSGNLTMYGWILPTFDNTLYETALQFTGTTTTAPLSRPADFFWAFDSNASGQVKPQLSAVPICSGAKVLFWNQVGEMMPGSGTRCDFYFVTDGTT